MHLSSYADVSGSEYLCLKSVDIASFISLASGISLLDGWRRVSRIWLRNGCTADILTHFFPDNASVKLIWTKGQE